MSFLIILAVPAFAATPAGMVDVKSVAPSVIVDMKYATVDNFLGEAFYTDPVCYLTQVTATQIAKAEEVIDLFHKHLVLWDCARPVEVQQKMWDFCVAHHDEAHCSGLVANPAKSKSRHTYGTTVDVSLADANGVPIRMPSKYDSGLFPGDSSEDKRRARPPMPGSSICPDLWDYHTEFIHWSALEHAMTRAGFTPIGSEWWHWQSGP